PPRAVAVTRTAGVRAIVATDRELTRATVSLTRVDPPDPSTTTVAEARRELVEAMAVRAFNRRLETRIAEGRATFLEAGASMVDWGRVARLVSARASGPPERWRAMLDELTGGVQQAPRHGFRPREIEVVRRALIAEADADVQREPTQPARAVLRRLNEAVERGEPPMSADHRRALFERLLSGIGADEVSRAFAALLDFTDVVSVVSLPAGEGVPDEALLIGLTRTAWSAPSEAPAELTTEARLMESRPGPARILEQAEHPASGVTSAWLDNGVRVHHRFVAQRRNEVTVRITVAGGEIE